MLKNKAMANTIALLLMLIMVATIFSLPISNAQSTKKTYAVIGATPNPVGVSQETLVLVGITEALRNAADGWTGITVTVTRPDNTTETLGPFRTDSTGLTGGTYVPTMVGTYTLQTNFPAQWYNYTIGTTRYDIWYEASTSRIIELVVQQEPIQYYPGIPLPSEYWTRPIDGQFREWAAIAGNWLTTPRNYFAPYNDDAPDTAHILWTKPLTTGGLVGGALDNAEELSINSYEIGDAYEGKWSGSLVLGGKLFYQKYSSPDRYKEIVCVDLHTGKELWSRVLLNNLTLTRGQLMFWDTYDYHGVYDYLWATGNADTRTLLGLPSTAGNPLCAFDPFTGDFVYALYGLPSGTFAYGPKGEFLYYTFDLTRGWMTLWNSTNIPQLYASTTYPSMGWGQWRPMGKIQNATAPIVSPTTPLGLAGYSWNKTIPTGLPGSVRAVFPGDKVVGALVNNTHVIAWGLSLKAGQEGNLLYKTTWNAPAEWTTGNLTISFGAISSTDGLFTLRSKENRVRYGFSTDTGQYLWVTEPLDELDHLMGGFAGEAGAIAYGKFFSGTVSGVLKAFDVKTGKLLWEYNAADPYMQVLWSNNWPVAYQVITDGKIYIAHTEHSPIDPRPRGAPFICLDVETGEEIWRIDGAFRSTVWGGRSVIGDSIIATMDTYDQRIYAIGKGPSATTISIQNDVNSLGSSILIKGMVTDISPGTSSDSLALRFPNGVPAISDESMSDWMLYVYKQFPRPTNATGVEVTLSVLDPNGNYYDLGKVTSDSSGMYKLLWTPEVPGEYTVIATFSGSKSYYPSYAQTALGITEAPEPTATPTIAPISMADLYFLPLSIGMIIAIVAIGAILAMLLLKKRP